MIGIFNPKTKTVDLVPVSWSFDMKSQRIRKVSAPDIKFEDQSVTEQFEKLVGTFGSKFAVKNMNAQKRLRKTKTATVAAMDKMDTAALMADDNDDMKTPSSTDSIYKTRNVCTRKGYKRAGTVDDRDYSSHEHRTEYRNIFQHEFGSSVYSVWEFPYHQNQKKVSKVYVLKEIIPWHIWRAVKVNTF